MISKKISPWLVTPVLCFLTLAASAQNFDQERARRAADAQFMENFERPKPDRSENSGNGFLGQPAYGGGAAGNLMPSTGQYSSSSPPAGAQLTSRGCPRNIAYFQTRMWSPVKNEPAVTADIDSGVARTGMSMQATARALENDISGYQQTLATFRDNAQKTFSGSVAQALMQRCAQPTGTFCNNNYMYHMLLEQIAYLTELRNAVSCRTSGQMAYATYTPVPLMSTSQTSSGQSGGSAPRASPATSNSPPPQPYSLPRGRYCPECTTVR
ncbi:MAG: hypothetical protein V4614_14390 [Pseudomonadota bacterium]